MNAQAAVGDPTGNVKFGWGHGTNGGEGTKYKVEITTQAGVWPLVGDANYMGVGNGFWGRHQRGWWFRLLTGNISRV
ncbi:MAG: hypothetical protein IPN19_02335 [Elusimicrobia bacterium]|nr:hypothetical protein [Elusimicrobiota bacterium]